MAQAPQVVSEGATLEKPDGGIRIAGRVETEAPDAPVEDAATGIADPAASAAAPAAEIPPTEPREARPRVDTRRAEIAARARANRDAERAHALNLDHIPHIHGETPPGAVTDPNDPDFIPGENDPGAAEAPPSAAAPTARAEPSAARVPPKPAAEPAPGNLLKVNGNTFAVTDEQLLQYAEMTADEADGLPRDKLITLAQKNIAAELRLQNSKTLRSDDRADRAPAATPAAHAQPTPTAPAAPRTPPAMVKELVRKIQLGDEDEAAEALEQAMDARDEELLTKVDRRQQSNRQRESVIESSQRGLAEVKEQYPDIFAKDVLASAHQAMIAKEIADEIGRITTLDSAQHAGLRNNPAVAAKAHAQAIAEGFQVAQPDEIIRRAAAAVAETFGLQPRTPSAPPPAPMPPVRRQDVKRQVFTNTARAATPQPFVDLTPPPPPANDREASRTRAMAQIRKARHQA